MSKQAPETQTINKVDGVLQNYLDQLLIVATEVEIETEVEVEVEVEVETQVKKEAVINPVALELPEVEVVTTTENSVAIDDEIQDWDIDESSNVHVKDTLATGGELLDWSSSQGVECLIFKVAGLKLAIPLSLLGGVFSAEGKVTPLFGQAAWSIGMWQADGQTLTVIDSAQLIMPERGVSMRTSGYEYLIQLDRAPWALACEEIYDTMTLVSESIKWRGDMSKRPWLAGTVISEMCALLDVHGLLALVSTDGKTL